MSVEGMWGFLSGSVQSPGDARDGGIVVLETGRVFGGDSVMAYKGHYAVKDEIITAKVETWQWNAAAGGASVFGLDAATPNNVTLIGTIKDNIIEGELYSELLPDVRLIAVMKKIGELP